MILTADVSCILLFLAMAVLVFLVATNRLSGILSKRAQYAVLVASFGIPFPLSLAVGLVPPPDTLIGPVVSDGGGWCSVSSKYPAYLIGMYYGWQWAIVLLTALVLIAAAVEFSSKWE